VRLTDATSAVDSLQVLFDGKWSHRAATGRLQSCLWSLNIGLQQEYATSGLFSRCGTLLQIPRARLRVHHYL